MSVKKVKDSVTLPDKKGEEKKSSLRGIRAYHKRGRSHCLAWVITDIGHFNTWRAGDSPLKSTHVKLPSGLSPIVGTQVSCGTCGETKLIPKDMIFKSTSGTLPSVARP